MPLKRIRIGGMSITTTTTTMYNGFDDFGTIVSYSIDVDPATGQSLGIGHIEYTQDSMGQAAINAMNRATFDGSVIAVTEDT